MHGIYITTAAVPALIIIMSFVDDITTLFILLYVRMHRPGIKTIVKHYEYQTPSIQPPH